MSINEGVVWNCLIRDRCLQTGNYFAFFITSMSFCCLVSPFHFVLPCLHTWFSSALTWQALERRLFFSHNVLIARGLDGHRVCLHQCQHVVCFRGNTRNCTRIGCSFPSVLLVTDSLFYYKSTVGAALLSFQ